jgi:hypothetical protein
MTRLIVAFRNFANAHEKEIFKVAWGLRSQNRKVCYVKNM